MLRKSEMIRMLQQDVVPALGCTEPVCVALCAATAAQVLQDDVDIRSVAVTVNSGIYKNGMSAGIPNCDKVGLDYAAALGASLRNPDRGLELLADITPETLKSAQECIHSGTVTVHHDPSIAGLYVHCAIRTAAHESTCTIRDAHTNIVQITKDGAVIYTQETGPSGAAVNSPIAALQEMTIAEMRELVDTASFEELAFLMDGIEMNERLAAYSEAAPSGVGLAAALRKETTTEQNGSTSRPAVFSDTVLTRIMTSVASAAESRLDGCPLPTMSSAGAGTKGLVVTLPVSETAAAVCASPEQTVRAVALAHLVNRYINAAIGKLSPMCTCVAAASTAAAVGIAYLLGATNDQLGHTVRNMTGTVTGMICDGGKVGCALKAAAGSAAALMCAVTAVHDAPIRPSDGIAAATPEECIRNMAIIGTRGMMQTDAEILHIMTNKNSL